MSVTLPTFLELYNIAQSEIEAKDTLLSDFNEGSALDVHCGGSAAVGYELVYQLGQILESFYISTAEGEDLDARLKDYNIYRKEAVSGSVSVTLTRETTSIILLISANTTFTCSVDDTEFYNESDILFGIGESTKTVTLIAKVPGTTGNILANTIDTITPNPVTKVTITHGSVNNGVDEESDTELRSRFWLTLSTMARGTTPALRTGALSHTGVTNAAVQKVFSGYTILYIDAGSGSPSAELIAEIQTDIDENWKAAGEKVEVLGAETYDLDISGTILVDSAYISNIPDIIIAIKEALATFLITKTMGAAVYRSELIKVVMSISGILDFNLLTPTQNIAGQASKIVRAGVIEIGAA